MKLKPGDRVRIKTWEELAEQYGTDTYGDIVIGEDQVVIFREEMKWKCGTEGTVSSRIDCDLPEVNGYLWPLEALDLITPQDGSEQGEQADLMPVPEPMGNHLIGVKHVELAGGYYYHYVQVLNAMRNYAASQTAALRARVKELEADNERIRELIKEGTQAVLDADKLVTNVTDENDLLRAENERLRGELEQVLTELDSHASEHIKSGGLRFYGLEWKKVAEVFADHNVHQKTPL